MLTRYLTARLGNREEAEDAVQEVFLKLHRADLTKSLKNPGAFLFRAATNVAIDIIRQRQRARHRDRDWTEAHTSSIGIEPVSEQPDAEAVIDAKARLRAIVHALEDLSPRVRQVFLMHKFEGLSHKEVAARLGISKSTVEKHMIAALKRLITLKEDRS